MKVSENFSLWEFMHPDTYKAFGDKSIWFLDKRIIDLAQFMRGRFKASATINTWNSRGKLKARGFRPPTSRVGAKLSQHRFGRAIDINIAGTTSNELRDDIINNFSTYSKLGVTTIEAREFAPTWCHIDLRQTNSDELLIVKP